ncbi:MAG: PAS domain-containing protein [Alphaproteobacteria bacterium]|nr:PAS domain-containing protein [Alphaproteobacteria bacterium]
MARQRIAPTGRESPLGVEEIIVSKTDLKGRITYANDVFLRVAHLTEAQAIGAPHSIVRHPEMPRAVFKLLWDRIEAGHEVFAYVLNLALNGDHYWVFAHVTPSRDLEGNIVGYHSNRRKPDPCQVAAVAPVYKAMLEIEKGTADRKQGLARAGAHLADILKGRPYDEFVFSI